ncbi:Pentatricopeptide repeat-containing protein At3g29230 [Linum grandiflorum]
MTANFELTISSLLPKCTFHHLKQIQALLITTTLAQNIPIFSKFLRRTTEFGTMGYSDTIFSQLGESLLDEETILWNVMIRGYAFNGPAEIALQLFDEMLQRGLKPHNYTYPYVISSCCELGLYRRAKMVHCQIVKSGFGSNPSVSSSIFNMYLKMMNSDSKLSNARKVFDEMPVKPVEVCNKLISEFVNSGDVKSAREVFDEMKERDVVSWNSMISGYAKIGEVAIARELFDFMPEKNVISWTSMIGAYSDSGDLKTAIQVFEEMPLKNVVSWNSMISSYINHNKFTEALDLFLEMQSEGFVPDSYTYVSVLLACSKLGNLEFGKYVHYLIRDWSQLQVIVWTALVDMYAQCGDIDRSFIVFTKMGNNKDVFCWNVMIRALAINGRAEDAIKLFKSMDLKPNDFSFMSVLFACSHGGLLEEGREIFSSMVKPKIEHYGCMVDLLCRNGLVDEAKNLVEGMPYKADAAILGSLLSGCKARSDLKSAETLGKRAYESSVDEPGVYALWSSIHASVGQWVEAGEARDKMEDMKIVKITGTSNYHVGC